MTSQSDTAQALPGGRVSAGILCLLLAAALPAAELRIRVTGETGRPIWARLEVRGPDGTMYQAPGAFRESITKTHGGGPFYLGSFTMRGEAAVAVPPGRYTVIAEHGLEYERVQRTVDAPARVALQLRPWIRMRDLGWWSGDMHIHHTAEEAPVLAQAEDLNVSVLTNRNKPQLFQAPWPADPVVRISSIHLLLLRNAEDERGGGAWILDGLLKPLALERESSWFPPGIHYVRQARAQRPSGGLFPWFDLDMPIWWETPVMMALATPDSLDILHNQFMQYGIDSSEHWGRPRDRAQFPGVLGFVDYSLGLYYRYLNLGFRVAASAGTGSGIIPSPVGYNRVYARLDGPLTIEKWYAAIRAGHSFVTNGPMLLVKTKTAGPRCQIAFEAHAREPIDRVEVIANGVVLKRLSPPGGHKDFRGHFTFDARGHTWVLARCFLKTEGTIRLAQSSPVYLDGKWDAREDARYFVQWSDELIEQTTADPKRQLSASQREELLSLYRRARAWYEAAQSR